MPTVYHKSGRYHSECHHHDGKVPPCIAVVQKKQSKLEVVPAVLGRQDNISMDKISDQAPSQIEITSDHDYAMISQDFEPNDKTLMVATIELEPATANFNTSLNNARATVWTEWRPQREKRTDSDDEQEDNSQKSSHEDLDDELVGMVMPEDDKDSENDSHSVDDLIEAEWEKEWAEMGVLYFLH